MTLHFECPECFHSLRASEDQVGIRAKCTRCGCVMRVPEIIEAGEVPVAELDEPRPIRFSRRGNGSEQIDMTPMVDVTFLLLIFFMITAAFSLQKAMNVPPVDEEMTSQSRTIEDFQNDDDFVIVRIDRDNICWVSGPGSETEREAPGETELLVQLRAVRRHRSDAVDRAPAKLLVLADPLARHAKVVQALDAGMTVGMEDVRMATNQEQ